MVVAAAEFRTIRRETRTWVMASVCVAATLLLYGFFSTVHARLSGFLAFVGTTQPRFHFAETGIWLLLLLLVGITLSTIDVRHRDIRDRIADVLDSRPLANAALLVGRVASLVVAYATMALAATAAMQVWGFVGQEGATGWETVHWGSVLWFLGLDALPALAAWAALVALLAVWMRNRLVVAIVAFALLGAWVLTSLHAPAWIAGTIGMVSNLGVPASDLASQWPDAGVIAQKGALLGLGAGFVVVASAGHWRLDDGARRRAGCMGAAMAGSGFLVVVALVVVRGEELSLQERWLAIHRSAGAAHSWPSMNRLSGTVSLASGEAVELDLRLEVNAAPSRELAFRFNPGMEVASLHRNAREVRYRHQGGLLVVSPGLEGATTAGNEFIDLRASGVPDPSFAWLDAAVVPRRESLSNAIRSLGTEGSVFADTFVALTPESHWLPGPAPNLSGAVAPPFRLELQVEVPSGWTAAGPGGERDGDLVRFRPGVRVTGVGIVAGAYRSLATDVDGVEVRLLLHPDHRETITTFGSEVGQIRETVAEALDDATRLGIPWPYRSLSLVEVPARLRAWGGGDLLSWSRAWPGVILIPETGLPTARFDTRRDPSTTWLDVHFANDRAGADPWLGFVRNLTTLQFAATGSGRAALDMLCQLLAVSLVGRNSHATVPYGFRGLPTTSAHLFNREMALTDTARTLLQSVAAGHFGPVFFASPGAPPYGESFDSLGRLALVDELDATDSATAAKGVAMRVTAVARILLDALGRESVGRVLARLRERHSTSGFTLDDFSNAVDNVARGRLPRGWLATRFRQAGVAGYIASPVSLGASETGSGTAVRLHVYNAESASGVLRIGYGRGPRGAEFEWEMTDPIVVPGKSAVEVAFFVPWQPDELWLQSYLSRNGAGMQLIQVPERTPVESRSKGVRASDWRPLADPGIVIDDLDDEVRMAGQAARFPGERVAGWQRKETSLSWGRYRRTVAWANPGSGTFHLGLRANLPEGGRWRLDFHVPDLGRIDAHRSPLLPVRAGVHRLGLQSLHIVQGDSRHRRSLDLASMVPGWLPVGEFDLVKGAVEVLMPDTTTGDAAIADAIRWVPVADRRNVPDAQM